MGLLLHRWLMYQSINLRLSVYNHPRDVSIATPLVHVSLYQSWFTIIQRMRLLLHWCLYRFISFGLQSSKGCVYWWNVGACTGLLVSGHNYLLDASISALLVPLWPPTYGVFGHPEPPYKKLFWDSMPANNFLQVGYVARDSWIIPIHGCLWSLVDPVNRLVEENLRVG